MKIALVGAAGAIGQSIASALRQAGQPYRVVGRSHSSLTQSFGHDSLAEIVTWNPDDPPTSGQQAMVDEIARQSGRPVKVRAAGKLLLRVLGTFNPFMREMVEMHYLLTEPVIMDDSALQQLIGPIAKTPYSEGIRQTLAAAK